MQQSIIGSYTPIAKEVICDREIPTLKKLLEHTLLCRPTTIIAGEICMESEERKIQKIRDKHIDVICDNINRYGKPKSVN